MYTSVASEHDESDTTTDEQGRARLPQATMQFLEGAIAGWQKRLAAEATGYYKKS